MATKPKPVMPDKDIVKDMNSKKENTKNQRYVRADKVEKLKNEGWKVAADNKGKHDRTLGIKANASDLVLMEK